MEAVSSKVFPQKDVRSERIAAFQFASTVIALVIVLIVLFARR